MKPARMTEGGHAIPFVVPDEDGAFEVTDEALQFLRDIDAPVAPIAVAGRYRTGKSFLMNCLVQDPAGFQVGPTIEACTHGIWLWSVPTYVENAQHGRVAVLWVDTEGLGATSSDTQHDARVFALATLLCSLLVYNSVGTIDEEAISQLGFVVQLTRHIENKHNEDNGPGDVEEASDNGVRNADFSRNDVREEDVDSDADSDEVEEGLRARRGRGREPTRKRAQAQVMLPAKDDARDQFFPTFLWVVRDFSLELVDPEDGSLLTAREYLETSLSAQTGFSSDANARNRVRRALTTFFKRRDCCTLVRPVEEEEQLTRLDSLPWKALRPEFRSGMNDLRARVLGDLATPKVAHGTAVTGRVFAGMAQSFVDAVNSGGVPNISGAWEASTRRECESAHASAMSALESDLSSQTLRALLPLDDAELVLEHGRVMAAALKSYDGRAVGPFAPALRLLLERRGEEGLASLRSDNAAASELLCARLAMRLWAAHVDSVFEAGRASFDHEVLATGLGSFKSSYLTSCRGPASHKALAFALLEGAPGLARAVAAARGVQASAAIAALESQMSVLREGLETATARASVYEKQCSDLRRDRTSGTVERARAEAEARSAKDEAARMAESVIRLEEEVEVVAGKLSAERREHAATRVQLRAAQAGEGEGSTGVGVEHTHSTSTSLGTRHASSSLSAVDVAEVGVGVGRKYKTSLMPSGGEHIAAPGHGSGLGRGAGGLRAIQARAGHRAGCGPSCTVQ